MNSSVLAWLEASNSLSGGWMDYAKLMFVLGGILILAFLSIRFWLPRMTGLGKPSSGPIQVLARLVIEPRKTLYVVGVGKTMILMANSEAGIQLMATLDPNDWDGVQARKNEAGPVENRFIGLKNAMKGRREGLSR